MTMTTPAMNSMFFLILLLLSVLQVHGHDYSFDTYVPYPDSASAILQASVEQLAPISPQALVYDTLMGDVHDQHDPFFGLKQVALRNSYQNHIFKLNVVYQLEAGLDTGCRMATVEGDNTNTTIGSTTSTLNTDCNKDCTHSGRYCFPHDLHESNDQLKKFTGNALVQEITRRACLGDVLADKFANIKWFEYLEHFYDTAKCLEGDLHDCSTQYMENTLQLGVHPRFQDCISNLNGDAEHPLLEAMLEHTAYFKAHQSTIPTMTIEKDKVHASRFRPDHILHDWCNQFPEGLDHKPIACDFCGKCNYVGVCLWELNCDKIPFDIATYKDPKPTHPPTAAPVATPAPTIAPTMAPTNTTTIHHSTTEETVIEDTKVVLVGGIMVGFGMAAFCFGLVEFKRRRAIREVSKELPLQGFRDRSHVDGIGSGPSITKVESPSVAFT